MKFFLVATLLLVSCSSFQVENHLNQFNEAKKNNLEGHNDKALKTWKELCAKKHKASCLLAGEKVTWHPGLAIMQGSTDELSTTFAILLRKNETHQFFAFQPDEQKIIVPSRRSKMGYSSSDWSLSHIGFDNLKKDKKYTLLVVSEYGELVDHRNFRTLDSSKKRLKWALTSCMSDHYMDEQKTQWNDLVSFNPDVLLMIGDNVYIDWGLKKLLGKVDEKMIWNRHVETRNKLEIFRKKKLIPVFATWDDHDFGKNNGGMNFEYKQDAKSTFLKFFPMNTNIVTMSRGPGVSSAVQLSGQLFMFMDNRYYRTPREIKSVQSHFGEEQMKWALKKVEAFDGPVWFISGDQFFGGYHPFESFQGNHPKDFKNFLSQLKKLKKKVLFLSGDRHLSEIMEIPKKFLGYKTYELTSSGIHSTTYPGSMKRTPNPLDIEFVDGVINYMIIESEKYKKGVKFHVKDYGVNKKLLFEKKLSVH